MSDKQVLSRATRRLTITYSAVMIAIVAVFATGVGIYASLAFDVELPEEASEAVLDSANATLRTVLIVSACVCVLVIPAISYALARRALRPVRDSLAAQRRFVDDAAHELRTPIAVAQGELELALLRERSTADYRAAIAVALGALEELASVSADLLVLSRTERLDGEGERIGVHELVTRAVAALTEPERARVVTAGEDDAEVRGMPELLVRAIVNLLQNAARYGGDGPIAVTTTLHGAAVQITVRDEGPGMPPEDVARAFDRFWRADAARQSAGSGIGLSLVQRIAEVHGGTASLRSSVGAFTEVTITVPVAAP